MINLLENIPNQVPKYKTKKCVEINNESRRTYNTNSQIKFKSLMLKLSLHCYSNV